MVKSIFMIFYYLSFICSVCIPKKEFEAESKAHIGDTTFDDIISFFNVLGKGTFGKVYKMKWDNQKAALKRQIARDFFDVISIGREARILEKLKGVPGVVQLHSCMVEGKEYFFVFERMESDLKESRRAFQSLTLSRRINFYKQLAFALAEIHERGIVHNDFKPANVMSKDEEFNGPKIIDFGMSCEMNDPNKYDCQGGSPGFSSPEKLNSENSNTNFAPSDKTDVWAFLLTIADIEKKGIFFYTNFYDEVKDECYEKDYSQKCFEDLIKSIKTIFEEDNAVLLEFVLSNLKYLSSERKKMWDLGKELQILEIQDKSFNIKNLPLNDFTLGEKYQGKSLVEFREHLDQINNKFIFI